MSSFNRQQPTKAERVVRDVLQDVTTTDAISSAYYANRILDFRKRVTSPRQNLRVSGVTSEPSDADVDTAWRLIQEIEQAENTRLQDLDDQQVGKYVVALSRVVGQRTRKEYGVSTRTKQDLVKRAMSRVLMSTPKSEYIRQDADGAVGSGHGTLVTVKPVADKESRTKRRGQAAGLPTGKPKKASFGYLLKSKHDG